MIQFKNIKQEIKVAKTIKIVEAILFLFIMSVFTYGYYIGGSIIDIILAIYALFLSYIITRELQGKRHYRKINIGYTVGVIIYTLIAISINPILVDYSLPPEHTGYLFIPIIILWVFNRFVKLFSDKIFANFNLAASIGEAMKGMNNEEFIEYKKGLDKIFDGVKEAIKKAEQDKIDETPENTDEDTNKNHT